MKSREVTFQKNIGNPGETWPSQVLGELQATLPELDSRALLLLAGRFAATRDPRYSREIFRTFKAAFAAKERAILRPSEYDFQRGGNGQRW